MEVDAVTDNEWREIYDTRRLSLWVRVPSLVIGGFLVYLAGAEIVHCVRDMRWAAGQIILPVPSKFIVAIVATGILAIFSLHLCAGQKRILLSLEQRALRIEDRWLGGWTTNTIAFDQIVRSETKGRRFRAIRIGASGLKATVDRVDG